MMETCATQAQVLQAMQTGLARGLAEQNVIKAKALTYQRDIFYFYDTNTKALESLDALARGTPVLPESFATYGIVHVPHWVEKRQGNYYLKDWELAAVLLNRADQSYPIEAGFLWPLIPIAQCAGEGVC
jgi:hypothetical protein